MPSNKKKRKGKKKATSTGVQLNGKTLGDIRRVAGSSTREDQVQLQSGSIPNFSNAKEEDFPTYEEVEQPRTPYYDSCWTCDRQRNA